MNIFKRIAAAAIVIASTFSGIAPAFAYERWVNIVNLSDYDIVAVRISNVDDEYFHEDLLGRGLIRAGYQRRVEPAIHEGYCRFDIEIEFEDGEVQNLWGENLCYITTITVDDEDAWTKA